MKVTIVGTRNVKFPDKNTGELIEYTELHCCHADKYVVGMRTVIFRCANSKAVNLKVPSDYDLDFNVSANGKASLVAIKPIT